MPSQRLLTLISNAFLFATILFALMAVPGFLSDIDSVVPVLEATTR